MDPFSSPDPYVPVHVNLRADGQMQTDVVRVPSDIATLIEMFYDAEIQKESLEVAAVLLHTDRLGVPEGGPWLSRELQENVYYIRDELLPHLKTFAEHPEVHFKRREGEGSDVGIQP